MSQPRRLPKEEGDEWTPARPFVKWAGGKSQLLPELLARAPWRFNRYFEPFVGGGALFFELQPTNAFLSDCNSELINAYEIVKRSPDDLIAELRTHVYEKDYYYRVRNIDRTPEYANWSDLQRAARLIYLNKTCFNGLYRVNSKGQFNTPFGRYLNPTIADERNLLSCSSALASAELAICSFEAVEDRVAPDDFVYFDPPYVPLTATSNFTGYSEGGFDFEMQKKLHVFCCRLDQKGVKFMLSNSAAPAVLDLYRDFRVEKVSATRAINSVAAKRGTIDELIVRNY